MPIHDWECAICGARILDRYEPRVKLTPPACPARKCLRPDFSSAMERIWSTPNTFRSITVEVDGKKVTFDSLTSLSAAEARSQERYLEAKKAKDSGMDVHVPAPFAVRHYSQDPSNMDSNVFGKSPDMRPQTRTRSGLPFRTTRFAPFTDADRRRGR